MTQPFRTVPALFAVMMVAATGAQATDFGHHPAVRTAAAATGIDANLFIVLPPASTTWTHRHAHADHPALAAFRRSTPASIDTNAFLVQPPASVTWTTGPAAAEEARPVVAASGIR